MDEREWFDPSNWINFYTAAAQIEKCFGCSRGQARTRLRRAFMDEELLSKKAPYEVTKGSFNFSEPVEEWTSIPPSEWRNREVDYDNVKAMVMVYEKKFGEWLAQQKPPPISKPRAVTRRRKRCAAQQAAKDLWPDGIPGGIASPDIVKQVGDRLKQEGLTVPCPDTILRAVGRK